jgi:MatE
MAFWEDNAEAGEYDYDFTEYVTTTKNPEWYFSAGVIAFCLLLNATLPLWLAIGKWWDQSSWQAQLNERRQRKREEKRKKLQGKGTRRFIASTSKKDDKSKTTTKGAVVGCAGGDTAHGTGDGEDRPEPRITTQTEIFDLGSLAKLDIDDDDENEHGDYFGNRTVGRQYLNQYNGPVDLDEYDETRSIMSSTSSVSNVASSVANNILDARPRRIKGSRGGPTEAYKRRGEKKKNRDIKMAGELIAAQHEDEECHPISDGTSSGKDDVRGVTTTMKDNLDNISAKCDIMSPLSGDAITPLDTVSNHGGDDDKSSVMTGDKHSAVPTVLRYKYRVGRRRKSCCTKLLEVADWDTDSRRLCSLAFIYAGQGLVSEFFSILKIALMSHYMGIREVNAKIITNTLYSFTGILVNGFTDALGLLVPQAHGADNPLMVGRYLQLVIVIYNVMQIPAAIIWGLYTYDAIIWFGYDEETAEIGQMYSYTVIIYMAVEAVEDCLWEWLEVVGHAKYAAIYSITAKFVEKGAFIALLAFGVTDLFTVGLAASAVGTVVVIVNITIIISMGWLDPYWTGYGHIAGAESLQLFLVRQSLTVLTLTSASFLPFELQTRPDKWFQ